MWVKICGITNEEDALMAVALGADAIGFVFAPSKRQVSIGAARDIARRLPPEIITVGVFRDQDAKFISHAVSEAGLKGVQLHGHETPALAAELLPRPQTLIVAFAAGSAAIDRYDEYHADAMLLDASNPGGGELFDWDLVGAIPPSRRLILAGGLRPENVAEAVQAVRPWGVDVSTGVESAPGQKDPRLVQAFIRAALAAEPAPYTSDSEMEPFDWHEAGDL